MALFKSHDGPRNGNEEHLDGLDICEIGGGYGGQGKMILDRFVPRGYTIMDLTEPLALALHYLSHFSSIPKVVVCGMDVKHPQEVLKMTTEKKEIDLVLSITPSPSAMMRFKLTTSKMSWPKLDEDTLRPIF